MMLLWLLTVTLSTICTVSGVLDEKCFDNCSCCKEESCGLGIYDWTNVCTIGCIDGHRGARCYELCQYKNCKSCGYLYEDKSCKACYDGYYLGTKKDCISKCPPNCKSCISSTNCTECKAGFYDDNGSTTCMYVNCPLTCECNGQGDCVSCKMGYYDTSASCTKLCPVNCITCESNESCNKCKYGFYNGYEYDNDINLRLGNCSYACRDTCTQCHSYNDCLQCKEGQYGETCHEGCSVGCENKTCLFDSGRCACSIDFTGDKCMNCVDGKYGLFCNETCSKYCKGQICDRMSGDCPSGCINENISGTTCNTCILGMFGELCEKVCPANCQDARCNRYSGICRDGCTNNFNGTKCDVCIQGKYGTNCELNCPVNCASKMCNRNSGSCFDCVRNFQGKMCNECKPVYYSQNCDVPCSRHCANYSCDTDTGNCLYGCMDGFSGDKCCVMSENCLECNTYRECKRCVSGFFKKSCNETCPGCCRDSCDLLTGECIISKDTEQQKDAPTTVPAVLGSMFTLSFALNIVLVLLAIFLKRKIQFYRRQHSRAHSEQTYENQLLNIEEQFPRTSHDDKEKNHSVTEGTNVYEGINRENEQEHEYQQVSYDHGTSGSSDTGEIREQMKTGKQPYRLNQN